MSVLISFKLLSFICYLINEILTKLKHTYMVETLSYPDHCGCRCCLVSFFCSSCGKLSPKSYLTCNRCPGLLIFMHIGVWGALDLWGGDSVLNEIFTQCPNASVLKSECKRTQTLRNITRLISSQRIRNKLSSLV